ncbi:MAG: efflux RND transporter permease subunit [Bacteroidales bacterium]|nr:efflux RND transporter permease subunit [Bacteroidales bacterium]
MAFLAFVVIGLVMYETLPVSLLPDIAIPQITVQASDANKSSQELEKSIIQPIRNNLLQVNGLDEIRSEVRDGIGVINMKFKFGTNTDLAYIEVNEKIDGAMNYLPQGTQRPKAIKASATDIPVFYLNISLKNDNNDKGQFLQMCEVVENIIRRRVEQLPEVAMADMTGVPSQCIMVTPDFNKMHTYGLEINDITNAITNNNREANSMRVKDGIYEYTIKVSTLLSEKEDVENIYITCGERIIQLKEICNISVSTLQEQGMSLANGKRVVTLAVIKQSDEGLDAMRDKITEIVDQFKIQFPNLDFEICRNQTELLDYTISNLKQNLIIGFILIILVAMLFMGGARTSLVIGISMLSSIIITFIPFYIGGRSLNIVSLSGLILVVGMMIDNALIVSENIAQWHQRGKTLRVSCSGATSEMISPLLSSSLTTVAVFIPLVFIDGMAGAIFSDQAFAITTGLGVSYIVGIMLLPVIYRVIMARKVAKKGADVENHIQRISTGYNKIFDFINNHKTIVLTIALLSLPICWIMFTVINKSKMPQIDYYEQTAKIEWNSEINIEENRYRTESLLKAVGNSADEYTAYIGVQDYVVDAGNELSKTEAELYWKTSSPDSIEPLTNNVKNWLSKNYPQASIKFAPPTTIFEKLFETSEADIVAQFNKRGQDPSIDEIKDLQNQIKQATKEYHSSNLAFVPEKTLIIDRRALELYHVDIATLQNYLSNLISGSQITELHSYSSYMPIYLSGNAEKVEETIQNGTISVYDNENRETIYVPIRQLVKEVYTDELKTITAGKNNDYIPIYFYDIENADNLCNTIRNIVNKDNRWEVDFSGAFFSNKEMMKQLIIILFISLMLMYFIMCAQFESFKQPLIVLMEIPIDASFALIVLWLCGVSINLMSGIGIIVSCGIIVNDSILKLDTINELRRKGMELTEAVHTAGQRRLRAIVMTSLTTIGATLPILFTNDMGSELQRPLAIAMISTMTIGTFVSLFIIPLIYTIIEKKNIKNE